MGESPYSPKSLGHRGFESPTFHNDGRDGIATYRTKGSLIFWYKEKYPPQSGIGGERLTIHDRELNDVRVVLPMRMTHQRATSGDGIA